MKTVLGYAMAFLAVGVLALIIRVNLNEWTQPSLPEAPVARLVGAGVDIGVPATSGSVDQEGIILLDESNGYPAIPYLQYATADGGVATKLLVFPWSRGCSIHAGDLPCVAVDEARAYPQIPTGTTVRVIGELQEDRILVHTIEPVY